MVGRQRTGNGAVRERGSDGGASVDHGTSMRRDGIMIGKLGGDYLAGVRGQKRNGLGREWRGYLGGEGLDTWLGAPGS